MCRSVPQMPVRSHVDEHVVDAELRLGHILQPEAGFGFRFDEGFHGEMEGRQLSSKIG